MKRTLFPFFLGAMLGILLLFVITIVKADAANTYYVAKTGSNSNTCTQARTITTPKLTIASVMGCLAGGDTLYIRTGTYAERIDTNTLTVPSGTSFAAATIISAYPGETVTLQPSGGTTVINFASATLSYVIVQNLILDGALLSTSTTGGQPNAVAFSFYQSNHIRVTGSVIKNSPGQGILMSNGASFNEVISNTVNHNGFTDVGGHSHGIYISTSSNLIEKNTVTDNSGYGIHQYLSGGGSSSNTIRKNIVHDDAKQCASCGGIFMGSGAGNLAYDNIIYNEPYGVQAAYNTPTNTQIYNNTIYNSSAYAIQIFSGAGDVYIKNNILYVGGGLNDLNSPNTVTATNLTTNPSFVNATNKDFHLTAGSAALNAGTTLGAVPDDFDGLSRPQSTSYDIGAYEYPGDTTAPSAPTSVSAVADTQTQITVTWTASTDNIGVTGYRVERCAGASCTTGFTQVGTPTTTAYVDGAVVANSSYGYRVRATDLAGNLSSYSTPIAYATTPAGVHTYYVDPVVGSDANSGDITHPFLTPHQAQIAAAAGDTIYFRDGVYQHDCTNGNPLALDGIRLLFIQTSGSPGSPITYAAYPGEQPVFMGRGYTNEDCNADGNEDGALAGQACGAITMPTCGAAGNERLIEVNDGVHDIIIDGLTVAWSNRYGIYLSNAHDVTVKNSTIYATWDVAIWVEGNNHAIGNNIIHHTQHASGVVLRPQRSGSTCTGGTAYTYSTVNNAKVWNNFAYSNGYRYPNPNNLNVNDARRVQPAAGDSAGGGNSDSFTGYKDCANLALPGTCICPGDAGCPPDSQSLCKNDWFDNNVALFNADDGFDISLTNMEVSNNISIANGGGPDAWGTNAAVNGVGFKVFSTSPRPTGNIWVGNFAGGNEQTGWELRDISGKFLHNTGVKNARGTASNNTLASLAIDNFTVANNILSHNANSGAHTEWGVTQISTGCTECRNNLLLDASGVAVGGTNLTSTDPQYRRLTQFIDPVSLRYLNIPLVGTDALTLINHVRFGLLDGFCPATGSAAIDAGVARTWTNPYTGLVESWTTYGTGEDIGFCELKPAGKIKAHK